MSDQNTDPDKQGDSVPLKWACTECGYSIEGDPPSQCPECGAEKDKFEEVPIPGF